MHWCCEVCNTSYKKAKWNFEHPLLDPSSDDIKFKIHREYGDAQMFLMELRELAEDLSFPGLYDELITYLLRAA